MEELKNKAVIEDINLLKDQIIIGSDYRAIVEMLNMSKGESCIINRLESLFDIRQHQIRNKNIKRGNKFAAKAICIGNFDKYNTVVLGSKLVNIFTERSKMFWPLQNDDKVDVNVVREDALILKFLYSSDTLTANITIIPTFNRKVVNKDLTISDLDFFEANKENLYLIFDEEIEKLNTILNLFKKCNFSNKRYKEFVKTFHNMLYNNIYTALEYIESDQEKELIKLLLLRDDRQE